jgi:hypothetical protein
MRLRPLAVVVVAALAVPLLASSLAPGPQRPTPAEPPPRDLVAAAAPRTVTTIPSPLGSTPTTRTPSPPVTGPTTTTVPKFSGFLAQSVDFVSADDGFVPGYIRCGKQVCSALRRTLDRGASWLALPPPPFNVGAPGDRGLFQLQFAQIAAPSCSLAPSGTAARRSSCLCQKPSGEACGLLGTIRQVLPWSVVRSRTGTAQRSRGPWPHGVTAAASQPEVLLAKARAET